MPSTVLDAIAPTISELARCIACKAPLLGRDLCPSCDRAYATRDGITEASEPPRGRNRVVAAFYDGPGWTRFRKWERLFLALQGAPDRRECRFSVI